MYEMYEQATFWGQDVEFLKGKSDNNTDQCSTDSTEQ
jgi:hypothetical protein